MTFVIAIVSGAVIGLFLALAVKSKGN